MLCPEIIAALCRFESSGLPDWYCCSLLFGWILLAASISPLDLYMFLDMPRGPWLEWALTSSSLAKTVPWEFSYGFGYVPVLPNLPFILCPGDCCPF